MTCYICTENLSYLTSPFYQVYFLYRGLNPQEAVSGFLRKVREMDTYGTTFHNVKYKESRCRMGLSPKGISFYHGIRRVELHDWMDVSEVSFKGKKVTIVLKDKNVSFLLTSFRNCPFTMLST